MFLKDVGKTLRRRWYVMLLVLLVSGALTTLIVQRMPATYRANASIVLVPPETTLGDTGNPYLFLGGLEQSVDVLSRDLSSEQVRTAMSAKGGKTATYTVMADYTTSAPIVVVTAEASTAAAADAMLDAVVSQVPVSLERLQAALAVRPSAQITTQTISSSERPVQVMSGRYRATVLVGAMLLITGILLLGLVDGLLQRRRIRRAAKVEDPEEPVGPDTPQRLSRFRGAQVARPRETVSGDEPAPFDRPRKTGTDG